MLEAQLLANHPQGNGQVGCHEGDALLGAKQATSSWANEFDCSSLPAWVLLHSRHI